MKVTCSNPYVVTSDTPFVYNSMNLFFIQSTTLSNKQMNLTLHILK